MNLSKSKYCTGIQCKKILWLDKNNPEVKSDINNDSVLDNGTEVGELAKQLFGEYIDIPFDTNLNNMIDNTKEALNNKKCIITEASFNYNNNFCSVDILKKDNDIYEIYEVKSSTEIKNIYLDDISYQYYVLTNLGLNVKKCSIVYINSKYIKIGKLDLNKLFNIENATDIVLSKQDEVKNNIESINNYMVYNKEPNEELGMQCMVPYECPYFDYCTRNLDKPNVFDIRRMNNKTKFDLYNRGLYKYEDLLKEDINWKFKQQIEYELYDKDVHIDKVMVKSFLDTLTYPLYFLDFETFQQSIPIFDYVKPYMQIPFQYSLHYIQNENGKLEHTEFLGDGINDPRRELAERLVSDIPINVCVLAYNMSFEKSVIKALATLYPDLSNHLLNIYDNMRDLMIPFKDRAYYNKDMHGSYSIKYVLPALFSNDPSLNYHNLDMVHNGSEAMNSYANLSKLDKEEQKVLRYNMLKYCELDTYAMVKIYNKLKEEVD